MGRRRQIADSISLSRGGTGTAQDVRHRVAEHREIEGIWQPGGTGFEGKMDAWSEGLLTLGMSEDQQYVCVTIYERAHEKADMVEVGVLVVTAGEADVLGRALLARVPSDEDFVGQEPGCGLIGLRIPAGL